MRYAPATLQVEFGEGFQLERSVEETHHTPADKEQKFVYCVLRKF